MHVRTPLLLDTDITGLLRAKIPLGECPQGWMLRHPGEVSALQGAFAACGADILSAPTGGLNPLSLAAAGHFDRSRQLCEDMVALTAQSAGEKKVAGIIASAGQRPEPFGPLPYTDLIDTYAEQALWLKLAGAGCLLLTGMNSLGDARAAVLGARQARLPILVVFAVDHRGHLPGGGDVLACLACLQELGLAAFGLDCEESLNLPQTLARLALKAKVPLLAAARGENRPPQDMDRLVFELLAAGARILAGGTGVTPEHTAAMRAALDRFRFADFPIPRDDDALLLLADENRAYYLEEDFSRSAVIPCAPDMSAAILEQEDRGADALVFSIETVQEAYQFGQNAHIASSPVGLLAGSEEALEMALLYYCGRAVVDARSNVRAAALRALAAGYGAALR